MEWYEVYFLLKLNIFLQLGSAFGIIGFIVSGVTTMILFGEDYKINKDVIVSLGLFLFFTLVLIILCLIPTVKELILIYGIPKLTNIAQGEEAKEIYKLLIGYLRK